MYKLTDDERANSDIEDARQRFHMLFDRVCNKHQRHPRVATLAMLTVLIDACQEPGSKVFDPIAAHELCAIVHVVATKIVEHHTGGEHPVEAAEKSAEQRTPVVVINDLDELQNVIRAIFGESDEDDDQTSTTNKYLH